MTSAIIVAAGKGTRLRSKPDKLFLEVAGWPVVGHTWRQFEEADCIEEIVLVVREAMVGAFDELRARLKPSKPFRTVIGGAERQDSVWNGLEALSPRTDVVAIHDGARPCVTAQLIESTVKVARATGAAVAARRLTDTVKESADGQTVLGTLDRSRLWAVQTPQTFRVEIIRAALATVREKGLVVTDDAAACERVGRPVRLVESDVPNPKVTVQDDIPLIELLLRQRERPAEQKAAGRNPSRSR